MLRKILFTAGALVLASAVAVWAEGTSTQIAPESAPQIITVSPSGDATMPACRYPRFIDGGTNDNPTCAAWLRDSVSLIPKSGTCPSAMSVITGLTQSVTVPEAYRGTATVMVNWTVRVEGISVPINPWTNSPRLCHPWHGTSLQTFPGGKVSTGLFVNSVQLGLLAEMTIPDGNNGQVVVNTNVSDPTISGSYVIKPSDFSGQKLPATLNIEAKWQNDTCMDVLSKAGYRSMVVTLVPQGNK